jgi:hypothetical protein
MRRERWRRLILDICALAAPASALYHLNAWLPASCQIPSAGPEKAAYLAQLVGDAVLGHSRILAAILVLVLVVSWRSSERLARSAFVAQTSIAATLAAYLAVAYFAVGVVGQQAGVPGH